MDDIKTVCIVGTGFMGIQLGLQFAVHGYSVNMHDVSPEALSKGKQSHRELLKKMVSEGKISSEQPEAILKNIKYSSDLKAAAQNADLVIESVSEDLGLKRKIFSELDKVCPSQTIIATGASVIKVSSLEDVTQRPGKVLNMHFYPPVSQRPLVELMKGGKTSDETIMVVKKFAKSVDLVPLEVKKEVAGFLFNRIWHAIKREALFLVEGGYASFEDIDRAWMLSAGMRIGIFGTMDLVGLDVIYRVMQAYYEESGAERDRPSRIIKEKMDKGELGQKSGKGFYSYPNPKFQDPDWLKGEK